MNQEIKYNSPWTFFQLISEPGLIATVSIPLCLVVIAVLKEQTVPLSVAFPGPKEHALTAYGLSSLSQELISEPQSPLL